MKPGLIKITKNYAGNESLVITCLPHVAIKLRRVFGGIQKTDVAGLFTLTATPQNAHELDWFRKLHPLDIEPENERRFRALVQQEKKRIAAVARFDDDNYEPPDDFDLALPLRDYQAIAADMAITTRQLLIGDEIGIGKTCEAIAAIVKSKRLPALIVTLTHLPKQWESELRKFAPQLVTHRIREGQPYEFGKKGEMVFDPQTGKRSRVVFPANPDVLITSYSKLTGWSEALAGKMRTVVFDEVQDLRHQGTEKYRAACAVAHPAELRIGASATPVYNYGAEIFAVMEAIAPDALGSWSEFLQEWCTGAQYGRDDKPSKVKVKDPKALGAYLRESGLMIRRTRKEIGRELPGLTVVRHVVDADSRRIDQAATDVRELAQRVLDRIGTPMERARAASDIDYRMRQATGIAKAPAIADFVRLLVESGERVLLGLWHHEAYALLRSSFDREGYEISYAMYTGQETDKQKQESYQRFVDGKASVLMMSLRSGAGLDGLQHVCSVVVSGELDWSPKVHEQFAGRVARDGQPNKVVHYYLVAEEGSDPVIAGVLGVKEAQASGINDPYLDHDAVFVGVADDHIRKLAEHVLQRTEHITPASRPTAMTTPPVTEDSFA